jgi:lichenan operon transcriptional antiterminator
MLNKREVSIFKLLYENKLSYITAGCIACTIGVSDKTARKCVRIIENELEKKDLATIKAKQGLGFQLQIKKADEFEEFYERMISGGFFSQVIEGAENRLDYLLNQLFFEQNTVNLNATTEKLFVSDSTLFKDIAKIKKLLSPYEVKLRVKGGNDVFVTGKEAKIRQFMVDYFFKKRQKETSHTLSLYQELLKDINIEDILMIVLNECRDAGLKLSDFIVGNLVLHIALSINRLKAGFDIELTDDVAVSQESLEYRTATKIIDEMTCLFKMAFPEAEAVYITMHLQSKATHEAGRTEKSKSLKEEIETVLGVMAEKTSYPLNNDKVLIENLTLHFKPFLGRLRHNKTLSNPLLDEVKTKYSAIFRLTSEEFSKIDVLKGFEVSEDEWAYVTLHVIASVEKYLNQKKLAVMLVGGSGAGHAQFMKEQLEYEFGSKLEVSKILNYYDTHDEDLSGIKLIISAATVPLVIAGVPTVQVSPLLTEKDFDKISEELRRHKSKSRAYAVKTKRASRLEKKERNQAIIANCFSDETFFLVTETDCKQDVLKRLANAIEGKEGKSVKDKLLRQLALRETYSSVASSKDVAIPHPVEAVTSASYVAVAVIPDGIYWDDVHPSVKLIFMVSPNRKIASELEAITQTLIPIVHNDALKKRLLQSKDFRDFIKILNEDLETFR